MEDKKEVTVRSDKDGVKNFNDAVSDINEAEVLYHEVVSPEIDIDTTISADSMPVNVPYKKIYNSEGELANPITKEDPYLTKFINGEQRRSLIKKSTKHPKNNKKGIRLIVTPFGKGKFLKTEVVKQRIEKGFSAPEVDSDGNINGLGEVKRARTIIHNKNKFKNE